MLLKTKPHAGRSLPPDGAAGSQSSDVAAMCRLPEVYPGVCGSESAQAGGAYTAAGMSHRLTAASRRLAQPSGLAAFLRTSTSCHTAAAPV